MTPRRYTQEDFDKFEVINGVKQCPSGDYSLIKEFKEQCSFGSRCYFTNGCSFYRKSFFGERCFFGEECLFGEECYFCTGCSFGGGCHFNRGFFTNGCKIQGHTLKQTYVKSVSSLGREKRTLYVWDTDDGIFCQVDCFFNTEEEFRKAVLARYGGDAAYLKALDLLKQI